MNQINASKARVFRGVQLAAHPFKFEWVSIARSDSLQSCDVYLPNEKTQKPFDEFYKPAPHNLPWNAWNDRGLLAKAHERWVTKDLERRTFRGALERVIERFADRTDPNDIVQISAAIDGLDELNLKNEISRDTLASMASAAKDAAAKSGFELELDRLKGLLGSISRQSLSSKIQIIGKMIEIQNDDIDLICKYATRLRNNMAHGGSTNNQVFEYARPTIEALLMACLKFDLFTSGFDKAGDVFRESLISHRLEDAIGELRRLG